MKGIKALLFLLFVLHSSFIHAQENPAPMSNQEIVKTFLNGFQHPEQIQASLDLLADDYHFKNPMVALKSKAEFIGLAQEIGAVLTGLKLINIAQNGEWVAAYYEFSSAIPGVESNLATEWFRVEQGKIQASHLIYDASEWRKIYEQMKK